MIFIYYSQERRADLKYFSAFCSDWQLITNSKVYGGICFVIIIALSVIIFFEPLKSSVAEIGLFVLLKTE